MHPQRGAHHPVALSIAPEGRADLLPSLASLAGNGGQEAMEGGCRVPSHTASSGPWVLSLVSWSSPFQIYSCHTFSVSILCDTLSPVSFCVVCPLWVPTPTTFLYTSIHCSHITSSEKLPLTQKQIWISNSSPNGSLLFFPLSCLSHETHHS